MRAACSSQERAIDSSTTTLELSNDSSSVSHSARPPLFHQSGAGHSKSIASFTSTTRSLSQTAPLVQHCRSHARAEARDGFRVDLADARLGDAEDLPDLLQVQVLVVVERDHEALLLGQPRDAVGE